MLPKLNVNQAKPLDLLDLGTLVIRVGAGAREVKKVGIPISYKNCPAPCVLRVGATSKMVGMKWHEDPSEF